MRAKFGCSQTVVSKKGGTYTQTPTHRHKGTLQLYIVDKIFTCRRIAIKSSASAQLNATKIAAMKVSHGGVVMFGLELLFSIYILMLFIGVFLSETARTAAKSQTTLIVQQGSNLIVHFMVKARNFAQ